MTDTTLADKLGALHVWPQHVADTYADTLTPREIKKLYEIGSVADKALRALRERDQAVEALQYIASHRQKPTRDPYEAAARQPLIDIAHQTLTSIEGADHE